jgi:hypothetical protein
MLSGYRDEELGDWCATDDQKIAEISDKRFTQTTFHSYPSLRSNRPVDGWTQSKPYRGEPFNEADWTLSPGGWDHEHCSVCDARITDGMTYWANTGEVTILCDRCHDHFKNDLLA